MNNKPDNAPAGAPAPEQTKQRAKRRLLAALLLIGVAIGGLTLIERWRQRPATTPPPHEPSQALIAPPSQESVAEPAQSDNPVEPPPPPRVVNDEKLPAPAAASPTASARIAVKPVPATSKAYVVQVGVFLSPATRRRCNNNCSRPACPRTPKRACNSVRSRTGAKRRRRLQK